MSDDYLEECIQELEEEILNSGYTYRDIYNARDAILAATTDDEEEARKELSRFKKDRLAFLFYMVGQIEGFKKGYGEARRVARRSKSG